MSGSIVFAGIAPHPPLLVPEVGGSRIARVAESERALRDFSTRLVRARPDTVVVISPHSPMDASVFRARSAEVLAGDFGEFYATNVRLSFENDLELLDEIENAARDFAIPVERLHREYPLDHGALVPLYYLREAGWTGPIVAFGFTLLSREMHVGFGRSIRKAAVTSGKRVAIVSSADLSHRLIKGGPYEYEPTAHFFDEEIVRAVASGDPKGILAVDDDLRERAGECGYRSILVAVGVAGEQFRDHEVLSYEGPFGVGYMVAVLLEDTPS